MFDFLIGNETIKLVSLGLIVAVIIVLLVLMAKYKQFGQILGCILGVVVIISGFFSALNINKYYNTKGGIVGKLGDIFNPNQVEAKVDDLEFNFSNVMLTKDDNNKYSATFETNDTLTLDENQKYCIFVNDSPCQSVVYESDFVIAKYSYVFYNKTFEENLADDLTIRFAFSKVYSSLEIETSGSQEAVNLWNSYFNKNEFIIKIKPVDAIYQKGDITRQEGEYLVTLKVNGEIYDLILAKMGDEILLPTPTLDERYIFRGWKNEAGETIAKIDFLNKNYELTADIIDKQTAYTVKYVKRIYDTFGSFKEDIVLKTEYLNFGDALYTPSRGEFGDGIEFVCWLDNPPPARYNGLFLPQGCNRVEQCTGEMTVYAYVRAEDNTGSL